MIPNKLKVDEQSQGVFVIAVTPFTTQGKIDEQSLAQLVDFYLKVGVTGITLLGMMGEAPKLTADEAAHVVALVSRQVAGRIPIVVGVSSPGLAPMGELARNVMALGASAVMVAPPSTLRTNEQILRYYQNVADELGDIPFVLQDFPLSTNVQISQQVLAEIINQIPTCVMLKHEDWPGLEKISYIREQCRPISILCGNGGLFLPEEMGRGANGAMTGFGFPEMMVDVYQACIDGQRYRAQDLFDAYLPLVRYEQQPGLGLAIRKWILFQRGVIATPTMRHPFSELTAQAKAEIDYLMQRQTKKLEEMN
ncbi:dihydrodipicolinate synthase family protein [Celerinatantimonas sp. MCCC 1A17872]|uniref:dihydrodipicolinate synthase family protein n=1 Tax=Celerinatantimonas sp. MCCC 1A17872 TaxID=3177514 RepID=UPI0038C56E6B